MNRLLIFFLLILLGSCLTEKSVDLNNPTTFIRYISDGYEDAAVMVEETADKGFIILANSTLQDSEAEDPLSKITLVKTDEFGHEVWREHFPRFDDKTVQYSANSLVIIPSGGYMIVGEKIETPTPPVGEPRRQLLLLKIEVSESGEVTNSIADTLATPNVDMVGEAVTLGENGNFLVLASRPNEFKSIFIGEFTFTSELDTIWTRKYGQGSVTLAKRLFYSNSSLAFGGQAEQESSTIDGFISPTPLNAESPPNGLTQPIGTPTTNDFVGDFCPKGGNFGFVGYTVADDPGDIVFYQVNTNGTQTGSTIYKNEIFDGTIPSGVSNDKKEVANSITATKDGGFMILGTIDTYTGVLGNGNTDLFMLKINGFGGKQWSRPYGSLQGDRGNCIRQTSDGGYIVLGTSNFGSQDTILLIKTDKNGEVN